MRHVLALVVGFLCLGLSIVHAAPPAPKLPTQIEELVWLKVQLSTARLNNFEQQKLLAEMTLKEAVAELAKAQKQHEALVVEVRAKYTIGIKDNVDEKGVITRVPAAKK